MTARLLAWAVCVLLMATGVGLPQPKECLQPGQLTWQPQEQWTCFAERDGAPTQYAGIVSVTAKGGRVVLVDQYETAVEVPWAACGPQTR